MNDTCGNERTVHVQLKVLQTSMIHIYLIYMYIYLNINDILLLIVNTSFDLIINMLNNLQEFSNLFSCLKLNDNQHEMINNEVKQGFQSHFL